MKKVVFCVPTMTRPTEHTLNALKESIPLIVEAGWEEGMVSEVGCPYISAARATMLRKALDAKANVIVFIDHDVSWDPPALLKLIETPGDVVAGTYRFKSDVETYMGSLITTREGYPIVRPDGCMKANGAPGGFLKITREAVNLFMRTLPHLKYGEESSPSVDLFNHGAHEGVWWGEDYAFCRNWTEVCGQDLWLIPDLNIAHHSTDKIYPGNFHEFMKRQPGGINDPARKE
jgi:glycosyltransferase involved in cell wall biosynthesis